MDIINNLTKRISPNEKDRIEANKILCEYSEVDFQNFALVSSNVISNKNFINSLRLQAADCLRDQLTNENEEKKKICAKRWLKLSSENRELIKNNIIASFSFQCVRPSISSQCIAYIAIAEAEQIDSNVLDIIIKLILKKNSSDMEKENAFETINYYCKEAKSLSVNQVNDFLTVAFHGLQKNLNSHCVQLEAMKTLINTVKYFANNFKEESERNVIMEILCESIQFHENQHLTVLGIQCVIEIIKFHYPLIDNYMDDALVPLAMHAIRSNKQEIELLGVEFFSIICELELKKTDRIEFKDLPEYKSKDYAHKFINHLLPVLFDKLIKQNGNFNDDTYTPSKAAGKCFAKLAKCCNDIILVNTLPFVKENINSSNWRQREAACFILGILLIAVDKSLIYSTMEEYMCVFNKLIHDIAPHVQDTAAWVLYKICELMPELVFEPIFLDATVNTITQALKSDSRTALKLCMAISCLSKASAKGVLTYQAQSLRTNCLAPYVEKVVVNLLSTSERILSSRSNLRVVAFKAVIDLIHNAPNDCQRVVKKTIKIITQRLYNLMTLQTSFTNYDIFNELLGLLCSTLQTLLYKITKEQVLKISDSIMYCLLCFYHGSCIRPLCKTEKFIKEPILVMSAIVHLIEADFVKYLNSIIPYVSAVLNSQTDIDANIATLTLLSDICQAIKLNMIPHCEKIMTIILSYWRNGQVNPKIRDASLILFGDMAVAIEDSFLKYLPMVFDNLHQATQFKRIEYDSDEEFSKMRQNLILAYSLIINALKGDANKPESCHVDLLELYIPNILELIKIVDEEELKKNAIVINICGLIGDIYQNFKCTSTLRSNESINKMLHLGLESKDEYARFLSTWAINLSNPNQMELKQSVQATSEA